MITGLPPYSHTQPLALFVRCPRCLIRYLVWTGEDEPRNQDRPISDYIFIDARREPFKLCSCGLVLDFSNDESLIVM